MFGYVKVYKPELKIKHYEAYKGVYCSVCRALGKDYGIFARMTLSYDITFLALARLCAENASLCFENKRCPFNPSKRCNFCHNRDREFSFAAAVGVLLTYYKLLDNIADDGFFGRLLSRILLLFVLFSAKKAKKKYPDTARDIKQAMDAQRAVEQRNTHSVDEASESVARLLEKLFSYGFEGATAGIMGRLGYCVGRFIYIADAADDLEKDMKKKSYNVYAADGSLSAGEEEKIKQVRKTATEQLNVCCAEAAKAFELLDKNALSPILENIIYDGLFHAAVLATDGGKKKRKEKTDEKSL